MSSEALLAAEKALADAIAAEKGSVDAPAAVAPAVDAPAAPDAGSVYLGHIGEAPVEGKDF